MPAETLLLVSALLPTTLVNYLLNSSPVPEDRSYLVANVNKAVFVITIISCYHILDITMRQDHANHH